MTRRPRPRCVTKTVTTALPPARPAGSRSPPPAGAAGAPMPAARQPGAAATPRPAQPAAGRQPRQQRPETPPSTSAPNATSATSASSAATTAEHSAAASDPAGHARTATSPSPSKTSQRSPNQPRRVNFRMPEVGQFSDAVDTRNSTRTAWQERAHPEGQRAAHGPSFEKQPGAILIEPPIGSLLQEQPRFPVGVSVAGLSRSGPETYRSTAPTPASKPDGAGDPARTRRCPFPAGKGHPDVPALLQPAGGQPYKCPLIALAMAVIAATDRGWPLMAKWQARFPRWSQ